MQKNGVILFIVGFILTASYVTYVMMFSGEEIHKFELGNRSMIEKFGPLQLDPDMSPIRISFHIQYRPMGTSGRYLKYRFSLKNQQGEVLWEKEDLGSLSKRKNQSSQTATMMKDIQTFSIPEEGGYDLVYTPIEKNGIIYKQTLKIKKNVMQIKVPILFIGGLITMCGAILLLLHRLRNEKFFEGNHEKGQEEEF